MIIITSDGQGTFSINSKTYTSNFYGKAEGDTIFLRSKFEGTSIKFPYSEVEINGSVPSSAVEALGVLKTFIGNFKSGSCGGGAPSVQADAAQTDDTAPDYIKNLPTAARTGSYNDLSDRPIITIPIVSDVTEMFTTNSAARFYARMTGHVGDKRVVELFGDDTSGSDNDLVITPALGFGADVERPINVREYANIDDTTPTDFSIMVVPETPDGLNGTFTIPNGCPRFYFPYTIGTGVRSKKSYWIDTDGTYHAFSAEDTPIENFCNITGNADRVIINGGIVLKDSVRQLSFGEEYRATTTLPEYFLYSFNSLEYVDISVFTNVDTIGNGVMVNCPLVALDVSSLANVRNIGDGFMQWGSSSLSNSGILDLDLTPMENIENLGQTFLSDRTFNSLKLPALKTTSVPNYFLEGVQIFSPLDLSPCAALTSADGGFMGYLRIVGYPIDTSPLVNLRYLGSNAFYYSKTAEVDLSGLIGLVGVADRFLYASNNVTRIHLGSVDWSAITVGDTHMFGLQAGVGTLYADSADIAQAFKTKMNSAALNTWNVVINPAA